MNAEPRRSSPTSRSVVVVGSLNMDLVFRVPRVPGEGETLTGRDFQQIPGGKGANQAVACARMGAKVAHVGCVGTDAFGAELIAGLRRDNIDVTHVTAEAGVASGIAMILVDDTAQNRIVLAPGANAGLSAGHVGAAAGVIADAALMVLQLEVPLETVQAAIGIAKEAGCPVLLNPAPARELPDEVLANVDYLVPNESEATILSGIAVTDLSSAAQAARALRARGAGTVLLTLGGKGVLVAGEAGTCHFPAIPVQAVDTTAAGDTFIGGFVTGLIEGRSVADAVALGQRAAALCVSRAGAQPSIPFRNEL